MEEVYARCAGLDVHKKSVVACRARPKSGGGRERETQRFGTTTAELLALVDWLHGWGCTHVAMESTGSYWKPVYNLLEGEFEVLVVNAQHVKRVPGRKTDVGDAEWLSELLEHGLLQGSFIPPVAQRDLRDLTRYRTALVEERAREINRVQKLLESANVKLASVATDILGASGRAMLAALVAGHMAPAEMAELARGRLRTKKPALAQALTGRVRPHHRFMLAQYLTHIEFLDEQIAAVSDQIGEQLAAIPPVEDDGDTSGGSSTPSSPSPDVTSNDIGSEAPSGERPLTALEAVELVMTIPGMNRETAEVVVAELGIDMRRFPTANHAASWGGMAPGNNESGGKHYSGRLRQGNHALRQALVLAGWAAARTQDTYLAAQYHRLAPRRGKKRAVMAVGHTILIIIYHLLQRREPYRELGGNYFDERKKESIVDYLTRRFHRIGYAVSLEPLPATAP
jgi:transposase